jgi:hypothetical protein
MDMWIECIYGLSTLDPKSPSSIVPLDMQILNSLTFISNFESKVQVQMHENKLWIKKIINKYVLEFPLGNELLFHHIGQAPIFSSHLTFIQANMGFFCPPWTTSFLVVSKMLLVFFFSSKASHYHKLEIIVWLLQQCFEGVYQAP